MSKRKPEEKERVFAYGFDRVGFQTPKDNHGASWETDSALVTWLPYDDSRRLEDADGIITVQGIFESISYHDTFMGDRCGEVRCDRDLMLERDRQVRNVFERGGWICFLIGEIVDKLPDGSTYGKYSIKD